MVSKKFRKLKWTEESRKAYEDLRKAMASPQFLHHPIHSEPFHLTTDASNNGVEAILTQIINNIEYPIGYFSKRLNTVESRKSATLRELQEITKAFTHFKNLFGGSKIFIYTDHLPLKGIFAKTTDEKFLNLISKLDGYNYEFIYKKGSENQFADDLSRNVFDEENSDVFHNNDKELNIIKISQKKRGRPSKKIQELEKQEENTMNAPELVHIPEAKIKNLDETKTMATLKRRGRPRKNPLPNMPVDEESKKIERLPTLDFLTWEEIYLKEGGDGTSIDVPITVPEGKENEIFKIVHDKHGHFSYEKTKKLIESRCKINNLSSKLKLFLRGCDECQRRNINMKKHPIGQTISYNCPGQSLNLDLMGPISPPFSNGAKYIVTIIDAYSRYSTIFAVKDYKFGTIAEKLTRKVFNVRGFPKSIKTDGSGNFKNSEFQQWLKSLNIKHEICSPNHSRGNSIVERSFKWTADVIAKITRERPTEWHKYLSFASYYYKTTVNSTTNYSPFFLEHLREPNLLIDQYLNTYSCGIFDRNRTAFDLMEIASTIRNTVSEYMKEYRDQENSKIKTYDQEYFHEGEKILIRKHDNLHEAGSKFKHVFQGPYTILKDNESTVSYKNGRKVAIAHKTNVKKYFNNQEGSNDESLNSGKEK
ncbi:Integrase, catalytic core domain and Ribonuclease H-like domain-containing protein [Strongyloides ratti]|uniref:RNA-directed DNA polymerase n=1 Tax=Strongyloides ratti TaxID=34506 RepID=A0A090L268_STRRB|nr:Integrase, catalytic core domain and Ribonuclease H-like domain-containing protein [Strongyloides ratti]CEF61574.1 Integrase, catalytic core domain and Ribonuclease H-like domain-containing protein [Strongyloides ratti]